MDAVRCKADIMSGVAVVIEDNAHNGYLSRFLLEQRGYTVELATDGHAGIALTQQLNPEVILLDIQLPGMDGYAVARAIRDLDDVRDIPIIAVTSYAMVGDRQRCLDAGCSGYIEKPIDPDTFVDQVDAIRGAAGQRGAL